MGKNFEYENDLKDIKNAQAVFRLDKDKFIEQIQEMDDTQLANEIIKHPEMSEFILPFVDDLLAFYDTINECYVPDDEVCSDEEARLNRWVPNVLRQIIRYVEEDLHYKNFEEYEEVRYKEREHKNFIRNLNENISFGYSPEEIIEFCEEHEYNFDDLYDATTLKEAYENNNIDYSIDDITKAIEDNRQSKMNEQTMESEEFEDLDEPEYIDALLEREKKSKEARDLGFEINEYGEIIRPNSTKTPLQQKEEELSSLEEEEKKISKAEALIKKEMDKKGKDIGE